MVIRANPSLSFSAWNPYLLHTPRNIPITYMSGLSGTESAAWPPSISKFAPRCRFQKFNTSLRTRLLQEVQTAAVAVLSTKQFSSGTRRDHDFVGAEAGRPFVRPLTK